jgi:tungstate transport system substrate-binding protein
MNKSPDGKEFGMVYRTKGIQWLCAFCLAIFVFVVSSGFAADNILLMATTTSTDNTGLLDQIAPAFTKSTGIELRWTAVGTGKALMMGQNCDVDVLLVHAPASEKKFVADGYGVDRREIMYNDFVIIGPSSDPAGIQGESVVDALRKIMGAKAVFASRGDQSGTHKKEIALWKSGGFAIPDKESWYVQTGQGMLPTIHIAAERKGYTMTDRGTFIKYEAVQEGNPPLVILVEGDEVLLNQYSVIPIDPKNCPSVKYDLAVTFSGWLAGPEGQKHIGDFKLLEKQLFTPNAK